MFVYFLLILVVFLVAVAALIVGCIALSKKKCSTGPTGGVDVTNDGLQFDNVQSLVKTNDYQSFLLTNVFSQLVSGSAPVPPIPSGRTILFQNQTTGTSLDIYLTQGYPSSSLPTVIPSGAALSPGSAVEWQIPQIQGWNGNFTAFPHGATWVSGGTLAEFGLNQLWSGFTPPLRDTFDISTVPPGIGTQCNNGPHGFPPNTNNCVYFSQKSGFSTQQSFGYNVGIQIIPPLTGSLPAQTVTCTQSNGNSANSIGFPNDTAFPKQQTIECLPAPQGNYTVNFLDPVLSIP